MHSLVPSCIWPDQGLTCNAGVSGQCPNQLSYMARALNLIEHYQTNEYWYLLLHPIFVKRFFRSGCLACDCTPHTNIFEILFVKFDIWATVYHEPVLTIKISSSIFNKAFTEWTARLRDLSCKIWYN